MEPRTVRISILIDANGMHSETIREGDGFEDVLRSALLAVNDEVPCLNERLAAVVSEGCFETSEPRQFEVVFRNAASTYLEAFKRFRDQVRRKEME